MGTYATDANNPDLLTGADLATDGVDNGDVVEADWWHDVTFVLDTATVAGTNNFVIQGCETSDFSTADVVTIYTFITTVNDDDQIFEGTTFVDSKYVRCQVTIGTGGDATGTTLKAYPKHYNRTRLNSADVLA